MPWKRRLTDEPFIAREPFKIYALRGGGNEKIVSRNDSRQATSIRGVRRYAGHGLHKLLITCARAVASRRHFHDISVSSVFMSTWGLINGQYCKLKTK